MAHKTKYKLARHPLTGQMQWTQSEPGGVQVWFGWLIMAVSTVLFLLVAGYVVYWFVLSSPSFDASHLPDGGAPAMRQEVQHLRDADQQR